MCRHEQSRYRTSSRYDTEPDSFWPRVAAGACRPVRGKGVLSLRFWLSCSLCILPVAAHAQTSSSVQAHPKHSGYATKKKTAKPSSARGSGVEEVMVTSRRRKETAQQIPETVQIFTGKELNRLGVQTLPDLIKYTTNAQNLDFYGGAMPTWVIRGVSLADFNPNSTPAAPIFLNDAYQPSTVMGTGSLFDISRVEVLKGPQSGLYGRNTIGGAVRVLTNKPNFDKATGSVAVSYGRWGDGHINAAYGAPITRNLAFRIAETSDHGWSGWQTSLQNGAKWGRKNRDSVRLEVAAKLDNWTLNFDLHGSRDKSQLALATAIGVYNNTGGFCSAMIAGYADQQNCLTLPQAFGDASQAASRQTQDGTKVLSSPVNQLDNKAGGAQFSAVGDLGGLELTSITSLDYFDYGLNYNYAATGPVYATQVEHTPMRMAQENLRLSSGKPKRLDWLLGLDVAYEDLEENKQFQLFDNALQTLYTGLSGAANEGILSYTQKTQSYSGYGQITYHILPKLSLDFGARSTWEYKTYNGAFQQSPGYYVASDVTRQYQLKDHVTGKAVLRYQFDPLNMVYASVARGYKSGGFYGGFPIASTAQIDPYREEQVWAVEAGFKAQTRDRKLIVDGAAFYYRTYNYQNFTTEYSAVSKTITSTLTNLGTAVNQGLEGNIVWKPVPTLTFNLGAAYNDAKIVRSSQYQLDYAGNLVSWQGQRLPYAPRWSLTPSARYEHEMFNGAYTAGVQMNYSFRTTLNASRGVGAWINNIPGYGLLDVRLDLLSHKQHWNLALMGFNVTNVHYRTVGQTDGVSDFQQIYGMPASYRFQIGYDF